MVMLRDSPFSNAFFGVGNVMTPVLTGMILQVTSCSGPDAAVCMRKTSQVENVAAGLFEGGLSVPN